MNILPFLLFKTVQLWRAFHSLFIAASVLLSSFLSFSLILLSMTLPPSPNNGFFNCCLSTLCEVLIVPHRATSLLSNNNTHTRTKDIFSHSISSHQSPNITSITILDLILLFIILCGIALYHIIFKLIKLFYINMKFDII